MQKHVVALLAAALFFLNSVAAQAQQFMFLPPSTTVNAVPYDSTTATAASVQPRVTPLAFQPSGIQTYLGLGDCGTVVGSDGTVYFPVKSGANYGIGRLSTTGELSSTISGIAFPIGQLTIASDGNVWGTYIGSTNIFKYDTAAATITNYVIGAPGVDGQIIFNPQDGNLYVGQFGTGKVMQIDLNGTLLATSALAPSGGLVSAFIIGPDGNVWGAGGGWMFAYDTSLTRTTNVSIGGGAVNLNPSIITYNGALWVMDRANGVIYKYDTAGTQLAYIPFAVSAISGAAAVPYCGNFAVLNDKIFAAEGSINQLVMIDPTTASTTPYPLPPSLLKLTGLVAGTDGYLYGISPNTSQGGTGKVYRLPQGGTLTTVATDVISSATPLQKATANGNGSVMPTTGSSTAIISVSGAFTATVNFEASFDNVTWVSVPGSPVGSGSASTSTSTTGDWVIPLNGGYQFVRARVSGYAAGTVVVNGYTSTATASTAASTQSVNISHVSGSAVSAANPLTVQLSQGGVISSATNGIYSNLLQGNAVISATNGLYSNLLQGNAVLSPTNGLPVASAPTKKATYTGMNPEYVVPATPTDMVVLTGSATKTVKINRIMFWANQTTAAVDNFYLIKRTAANTGGVTVAVTPMAHDSNDAAATAVMKYYTTNAAALGTSGNYFLDTFKAQVQNTGAAVNPNYFLLYDTNSERGEPITLRGTAESLALNFNGAALPAGLKVQIQVTWTEE